MAPTYASLFMGKLERDLLEQFTLKPSVRLRFLDDIFMIWDHSLAELEDFVTRLNSFHQTIKFTHTVSATFVSFLDVNVTKMKTIPYLRTYISNQWMCISICIFLRVTRENAKNVLHTARQNGTEESYLMMTASMDHLRNLVNTFKTDITQTTSSDRLSKRYLQ